MKGMEPLSGKTGRIALFIPSLAGGGAERSIVQLCNGLAMNGYSIDLLVKTPAGPYRNQVNQSVRIVDLHAPRMIFTLPRLVKYLRAVRPHTLITALELPNLYGLLARKIARVPTRLIISIHSLFSMQKATLINRAFERGVFKAVYSWADAIVCVSHSTANDLVSYLGINPKRVRVIYNPVITPELIEQSQFPLRDDWFQPGHPPVILAVGRLTYPKDYPTLLHAFARLNQRQPAHLMILGEGEDRAKLEALADKLGIRDDVRMPGFTTNPFLYMRNANVFVLSSEYEGLPNVLTEAMACRCPVISTDCPGGAREILNNGLYGHLTQVGDAEGMAAVIRAVLAGDTRRPPPEWLTQFEIDTITQEYIHLIGAFT